jgi:peptidoglycan/LPS O-acetylase OafA/YrhL
MMKKVTENSNKVFVAVLSMLSICYFLWICFRVPLVFHFDNYQEISFFVGFFLLGGYIFAIFLKVLGNPEVKVISKILFVITALLCVVSNIVPPQVKMEFLASKIRHYPSPQPKL